MSSMTISEVKQLKGEMEDKLTSIIRAEFNKFSSMTGLPITDIRVVILDISTMEQPRYTIEHVRIEVKL